jgi:hypothetical protein
MLLLLLLLPAVIRDIKWVSNSTSETSQMSQCNRDQTTCAVACSAFGEVSSLSSYLLCFSSHD